MSEQTGQTGDALQQEREMREHEAEARRRDSDERSPDASSDLLGDQGAGAGSSDPDDASPPGTAGRLTNSGG